MAEIGDLTNIDNVIAWVQLSASQPVSDTDTLLLEGLITAASDFIHQWLGRYLPEADYEDVYDGSGGARLPLKNYPVRYITSLSIDDINIREAANTLTAGYAFSDKSLTLRGYRFTRGLQNVVVRYHAGYDFFSIPPAVVQACNEVVAQKYRERARIGIKQQTQVGVASYTYNVQDLLPNTLTALGNQRDVRLVQAFSTRL